MKPSLYESFYHLKRDPFRLTPDGHFTYSHPSYHRALAFLKYAAYREEGFVMITGRPGTGKTTLINDVVSQFDQEQVLVATLVTTQLEAADLLHVVASYFHIHVTSESKSSLLLQIEQFLRNRIDTGKRVILIVDEAQGLQRDAVEELRLLSNLAADNRPMLQIFLVGQKELRDLVNSRELEQLHQRITAAANLSPLTHEEVSGYIRHRMVTSGWSGDPALENAAIRLIHHVSEGIPRKINLICSRLLLHGSILEKHTLLASDLEEVLAQLREEALISGDGPTSVEDLPDLEPVPDGFLEAPAPKQPDADARPAGGDPVPAAGNGDVVAARHGNGADAGTATGVEGPADGRVGDAVEEGAAATQAGPPAEPGGPRLAGSRDIPAAGRQEADSASPSGGDQLLVPAADTGYQGSSAGEAVEDQGQVLASIEDYSKTYRAWMRLILAMGATLVGVVVLFLFQFVSGYLSGLADEEAGRIADQVSAQAAELRDFYGTRLAGITGDSGVAALLERNDPAALRKKELALQSGFSWAATLRLLPVLHGNTVTGSASGLGYAELAQVYSAEAGKTVPLRVQQPNTAGQHVNIIYRIMDADRNQVAGSILVSLGGDVVKKILGELEVKGGYIELRQSDGEGGVNTLASHGNPAARKGTADRLMPVRGTAWQVAYWPPVDRFWQLRKVALWLQILVALTASAFFILIVTLASGRRRSP